MESLFTECIDLYMRHLFPITPLIHEPSLRETASKLSPACNLLETEPQDGQSKGITLPSIDSVLSPHTSERHEEELDGQYEERNPPVSINLERSLTLLTALGAAVASLLPTRLSVPGLRVAAILLNSSRQMLHTFEDWDIAEPCANSIIVRYLHVQAIHASGKVLVSWYILIIISESHWQRADSHTHV